MRWIVVLLLVPAALALPGCNTIKGMGTDIHDIAQNTQRFWEDSTGFTTDSDTPSPNSPSRPINRQAAK